MFLMLTAKVNWYPHCGVKILIMLKENRTACKQCADTEDPKHVTILDELADAGLIDYDL